MAGALLRKTGAGPDYTLDALNWNDINVSGNGNSQTISGLGPGVTVTLQFTPSGTSGDLPNYSYNKNGSGLIGISIVGGSFTVTNGDTIVFNVTNSNTPGFGFTAGTVTITNTTDGGAAVDSFTYNVN